MSPQVRAPFSLPDEYSRVVATSGPPLTSALSLGKVELRPGQRRPTKADLERSTKEQNRSRIGQFPNAGRWEITPERAETWAAHRFAEGRGADSLGAMIGDEWGLFLSDLDCYEGLRHQGKELPPLHEYLRPGREHWGEMREVLRAGFAAGEITAAQCPTAAREAGLFDSRDQALRTLAEDALIGPAELAALDVGDLDWEECRLRIGGEWRELDELPFYFLECYLDLRPDLAESDPLFLSREGGRMSERQLQRIVQGKRGTP